MFNSNPTDALLTQLEAAFALAKDEMHLVGTSPARKAYYAAADAYNKALDAAEQDGARNWAR